MRMRARLTKSGELATCKALGILAKLPSMVGDWSLHVEGKPVHGCNACAVHFGTPTRSSSS